MLNDDQLRVLLRCKLFAGMAPEVVAAFANRCTVLKVSTRSCIFKEGDRTRQVYIILHGELGVRCHILEEQVAHVPFNPVVVKFGPGEIMGEFPLVDAQPRSADAIATQDSELLMIDPAEWDQAIQEDPKLGCALLRNLSAILAARIRRTSKQLMTALEWNWKTAKFDQV